MKKKKGLHLPPFKTHWLRAEGGSLKRKLATALRQGTQRGDGKIAKKCFVNKGDTMHSNEIREKKRRITGKNRAPTPATSRATTTRVGRVVRRKRRCPAQAFHKGREEGDMQLSKGGKKGVSSSAEPGGR